MSHPDDFAALASLDKLYRQGSQNNKSNRSRSPLDATEALFAYTEAVRQQTLARAAMHVDLGPEDKRALDAIAKLYGE